jgi:hypothetical protein
MKLKTVTNVSLDGVTQGHRRIDVEVPGEDDAPGEYGGFERFGWGPPLLDDEASTFKHRTSSVRVRNSLNLVPRRNMCRGDSSRLPSSRRSNAIRRTATASKAL